ncbi:heat stress transcription factor B-3 [Heracleum sosnowskyi]|uniref:Heat stress transcription factor B-3 n=1 Tax=Heracleum sosnowskyi TaxID=360622 RepID=A0AAD8HVT5_9APIA|nr:heat stress transcription factor B-3 [Heracleum sosnowskyi]
MQQAQGRRKKPTAFLSKLYEILHNPEYEDLIAWTADGKTFIVKNKDVFARDVLPRYFKTNIFHSFTHQLPTYGFTKLDNCFFEYQHDLFTRGTEKHQLCEILTAYRKNKLSSTNSVSNVQLAATSSDTAEGQAVVSSASLPEDGALDPELVRENKRLRKENEALKHELHMFRSTLNYVAGLMKGLGGGGPESAVPLDEEARG